MTPKEKALTLFHKYARMWHASSEDVKQCALIAVDEIINEPAYADSGSTYWQEVKQEIEKL